MKKFYYHITDTKNIDSILTNGLRANADGEIFMFDNVSIAKPGSIGFNENGDAVFGVVVRYIADIIALEQIGISEYAMFEIDSDGINGLTNDDVAEMSSMHQWIAKQSVISPQFINLFGIYKAERFGRLIDEDRTLTDEEKSLLGL